MNENGLLTPLPPLPGHSIPTPIERAWLAGFIDGEGTIGLSVAKRTGIISTYFMLPNTNLNNMGRARVMLSALLGRDVRVAKRGAKGGRRPIYVIAIQNQPEIKCILEYIGPWLVGKRAQGDLMLRYINEAPSRKRGPISEKRRASVPTGRYTARHYDYVQKMQVLNRRYAPGEWHDEPAVDAASEKFLPSTPDERLDDAIRRWWRLRFDY